MLERSPAREFVEWIIRIGASPYRSPPTNMMRWCLTSHLPQLLSTTLAALMQEKLGVAKARVAAGRGLRDMTRLAESDYRIWKDILATNPDRIVDALDSYLRRLSALCDKLQATPPSRDSSSPRRCTGVRYLRTIFPNHCEKLRLTYNCSDNCCSEWASLISFLGLNCSRRECHPIPGQWPAAGGSCRVQSLLRSRSRSRPGGFPATRQVQSGRVDFLPG